MRSFLDTIIKVRENRLNDFSDTVIRAWSTTLEQKFNRGEKTGLVKRPKYDLINGTSSIEVNRLMKHFVPSLQELNKNERIRESLLSHQWIVYYKQR